MVMSPFYFREREREADDNCLIFISKLAFELFNASICFCSMFL